MHLDVVELRRFYYRQALGRVAQRSLRNWLVQAWAQTEGMSIGGFGFAAPLLRPFLQSSERVICMMPGQQGVMQWPEADDSRTVMVEEAAWPLASQSLDRLVMLHGLEASDHAHALLDEARRVLTDSGEMVLMLPNRRGLWARSDQTPFGFGRPYSLGQAESLLQSHGFDIQSHDWALYSLPSHRKFSLRSAAVTERIGRVLRQLPPPGVMILRTRKISPPSPAMIGRKPRLGTNVIPGIIGPRPAHARKM